MSLDDCGQRPLIGSDAPHRVPIATLEWYVRTAARSYAQWSKSDAAVNLTRFSAYRHLVSDTERRHYLQARLERIRAEFEREFLARAKPKKGAFR